LWILVHQIRGSVPVIACRCVNSSPSIVNMTTGLCYYLCMLKVNKGIYICCSHKGNKCYLISPHWNQTGWASLE
jgi:hypothetical protein